MELGKVLFRARHKPFLIHSERQQEEKEARNPVIVQCYTINETCPTYSAKKRKNIISIYFLMQSAEKREKDKGTVRGEGSLTLKHKMLEGMEARKKREDPYLATKERIRGRKDEETLLVRRQKE